MAHLVWACVGVCLSLVGAAWVVSASASALKERSRRLLLNALRGGDEEARALARQTLEEAAASTGDISFARELFLSEDPALLLDAAMLFLKRGDRPDEGALEALAKVAAIGSRLQRRDAHWMLRAKGTRCASLARPMTALLESEPDSALRIEAILFLVELARKENDTLDSATRAEVVKAVVRRLLDPTREVRFTARVAIQAGGPLQGLVKEAEVVLMEILRSSNQDAIDAAAAVILENKGTMKAALSCVPASRASSSLIKGVL